LFTFISYTIFGSLEGEERRGEDEMIRGREEKKRREKEMESKPRKMSKTQEPKPKRCV
jgi:hypothetical protein